jgi:hypothetical protein
MNIGSINISTNIQSGSDKIARNRQNPAPGGQNQPVSRRGDKLDISAEALSYKPIQARIASGFYDKIEIVKEVAQRMAKDL